MKPKQDTQGIVILTGVLLIVLSCGGSCAFLNSDAGTILREKWALSTTLYGLPGGLLHVKGMYGMVDESCELDRQLNAQEISLQEYQEMNRTMENEYRIFIEFYNRQWEHLIKQGVDIEGYESPGSLPPSLIAAKATRCD